MELSDTLPLQQEITSIINDNLNTTVIIHMHPYNDVQDNTVFEPTQSTVCRDMNMYSPMNTYM